MASPLKIFSFLFLNRPMYELQCIMDKADTVKENMICGAPKNTKD